MSATGSYIKDEPQIIWHSTLMVELSEVKLTWDKAWHDVQTRNTGKWTWGVTATQHWTKKFKVCADLYLWVREHCMMSLKNGWVEDSGLQQEALMSFVSCKQQTLTCLEHQAGPKQRQNLRSFDLCSTINYFAHTFCENGTDLAPTHPIWWDSAFNHRHK